MTVEADLDMAANQTIRVPSNIMGLLRQSYDSREKMLDWMLAIGVTVALVVAFRDELRSMLGVSGDAGPNVGRRAPSVPNQDLGSAFPYAGRTGGRYPALYAYNMPTSRNFRYGIGPSGTRPPDNPSTVATYDKDIR